MKFTHAAGALTGGVALSFALTGLAPVLDSADQPTDEQIAYAEQVAAFAAENPAPVAPEGSDKAELNAFALEQLEYLQSVPWEAVTGQWGCAVDVQEPVLSELGGDVDLGDGVILEEGTLFAELGHIASAECGAADVTAVQPRAELL